MSKWVKIEDGLPLTEEDVLLTIIAYPRKEDDEDDYDELKTVEGYLKKTPWKYDHEEREWFIFNQDEAGKKVIAWQPKPEPFEEEDKDV